jgi:hypothetical protein
MSQQHVIDLGLAVWSVAHDGLFLLALVVFERLGWRKHKKALEKTIEERLAHIERLHNITPETVSENQ